MLLGHLHRLGFYLVFCLALLPQVGRAAFSQPAASSPIRLPDVRCADEDSTCFGISYGLITWRKFELVESNTFEFLERL